MNRTLTSRIIVNGIRKSSTEVLIPFATIYLAHTYGKSITGFIIVAILLSGTAFNFIGGYLIEKYHIKTILITTEIFHISSLLFMLISSIYGSHTLFIFFYFVKNLFFSMMIPSNEAILAISSENKSKTYTLNQWVISFVVPIFSIIGAYLFEVNFSWVIFISLTLSIACLIITWFFLPTPDEKYNRDKNSFNINLNFKYFSLWLPLVMLTSISFVFPTYFAISLSNVSDIDINGLLTFSGIEFFGLLRFLSSLAPFVFILLYRKWLFSIQSKQKLTLTCALWCGLTLYLYFFSGDNGLLMMSLVILLSILSAIYYPPLYAKLIDTISDNNGFLYSMSSLVGRVANMIASALLIISDNSLLMFWLLVTLSIASVLSIYIAERSITE